MKLILTLLFVASLYADTYTNPYLPSSTGTTVMSPSEIDTYVDSYVPTQVDPWQSN